MPKTTSTALKAATGEFYVASVLSGAGMIVALPRAGVPNLDMLVSRDHGGRAIRLQVKTGTQARRNDKQEGPIYLWSTSYAVIERQSPDLWFAFVWLNGWPEKESSPELFFVPSCDVAECMQQCKDEEHKWPYFWMRVSDAEPVKGLPGLQRLMQSMDS